MAVRIHVAATVATEKEIRNVFREILGDAFEKIRIESTPPWSFFTASVWGVDRANLIQGLEKLHHTGLLATTEDASRWHLTLMQPRQPPLRFLHEFYIFRRECDPQQNVEPPEEEEIDPRLAFLQPDPDPQPSRPWSPFDQVANSYAEMGAPIADAFRDSVQHMTYGQAVNAFRLYEANRLADAFTQAGLAIDRQPLLDALLWKSTTDREDDADIGNLPRVLLALGLHGSIADFFNNPDPVELEDSEQTAETANAGNPYGSDEFISQAIKATESCSLLPVKNGPLECEFVDIPLLDFIKVSLAVGSQPFSVLTVSFPSSMDPTQFQVPNPRCIDIEVRPCPHGWQIGLKTLDYFAPESEESAWREDLLKTYLGEPLAATLRSPPPGSHLEYRTGHPDYPSTQLRFAGPVAQGKWLIESAWPAVDRDTLQEVLDLARNRENEEWVLRDEAEADAIMHAVSRDDYLHNMEVQRDGNRISCDLDIGNLAVLMMRHRYSHIWDFKPVLEFVELQYNKRRKEEQIMRRALVKNRKHRSPPLDKSKVIYRGKASTYWKSDMASWTVLEAAPREAFEAALAELGFKWIGDFVCKKLRDYVLRYFLSEDQQTYAIITASAMGYLSFEFVSHFENDAHLTTSNSWIASSHPEIEMYAQVHPELPPKELYEKHKWGINRFLAHKNTHPIRYSEDLSNLCELFDSILIKTATIENDLITVDPVSMEEDSDE